MRTRILTIVIASTTAVLFNWALSLQTAAPHPQSGLALSEVTEPPDTVVATSDKRRPHAPPSPEEVRTLSIRQLGNFDYDRGTGGTIPTDVVRLSGMKVRLRGYMVPISESDHLGSFALVPSVLNCCFGQPPTIQHTVLVDCPRGKTANYCQDEIIVEGTLFVRETKEDGNVVSLFRVACTDITLAPKP